MDKNIKIKYEERGHETTFNNLYEEKIGFLQRIKQLFCKHNWKEIDGQGGYFHGGIEFKTKHYKCTKCKLRLNKNTFVKDHHKEY